MLADKGYSVYGVERSSEMVALATKTPGFYCEQGDICTVKLGRYFDAVLSLFHVVSYQISNGNLKSVFLNAAQHLNINGLFIFDFWYSPAVNSNQPQIRIKRVQDRVVEVVRIAEPIVLPNDNRVDVNYTIYIRNLISGQVKTFQESHPIRHFSLPEIDFIAEQAGFQRIHAEEFFSGKEPGLNTWGVCVILRKLK